jgi:hypothetical protein
LHDNQNPLGPTHQKFFRRFYEICFTLCTNFILLTGERGGDLRHKQNSIERAGIWFMLQISDTLFCSGATILN